MKLNPTDIDVLKIYTGLAFDSDGLLLPKHQFPMSREKKIKLWNEERDILIKSLVTFARVLDDLAYQYKVLRKSHAKGEFNRFKRLYNILYTNKTLMDKLTL